MSWEPALEPTCPDAAASPIETLIIPRARDIGGFEVRRALPAPRRQLVGPFIFFDRMGPADFVTGQGIDVRPHPDIGLATVTYLFDGEFQHRDSLGTDQMIYPGAVNWMVAGHGVTHSERTSAATRAAPSTLSGIQTWVALPLADEERAPGFQHVGKSALPEIADGGVRGRLILGRAYGERAPVETFSDMFYLDVVMAMGAKAPLPDDHEDRAVFVVDGEIEVAGDRLVAGSMAVFRPGDAITLTAGARGARIMLLGGATLEGSRHIWWNFVASSKDKIEAAAQAWREGDWTNGRFRLPPGDADEFIPLPDKGP